MGETKVIYHLDEQETPYLVKISVPAHLVTLSDLKNALKKPNYKFFFKSMDDDFGVVKEEITDDNAKLPCYNGRVVCWLVSADGSHSDGCSVAESQSERLPSGERSQGIGDSRPPSFHPKAAGSRHGVDDETETDSVVSHRRERDRPRRKHSHDHSGARMNGYSRVGRGMELGGYDVCDSRSSLMSSELESSSCFDSDDDGSTSRFSSVTEQSGSSRMMRRHRRRRRKPKPHHMERSSSFSSITDSTMSLNIITVTLNMEKYNFLGISIVGQSNERGDGGIYIGSIMKGGAVAADGRIEPGDMLLQVNDINFENMCNDDAVRVLRDIVHKPGPVSLTVAKCWDPNPNNCFTPRSEPIRPIDPAAWVSHTAAMTGIYPPYGMSPSMSTVTSTSSSISSSIPETERFDDYHLSVHSDMATVAKAMACPDSGLEVRDRMWLKITIANAFIGSDVVDWLFHHVEGFADRREARKYASNLLKAGFIRHTVNKITFSEQCYYVFGDLSGNMAHLSLQEHDGSSGASDQDTLAPLLHPAEAPWPSFPYQYPPSLHDAPHHHAEPGGGSAGSHHSEGSSSSNCSWSRTEGKTTTAVAAVLGMNDVADAPEFDLRRERAPSEGSIRSSRSHSHTHSYSGVSGPRHLVHVPPELSGSRRSCLTTNGELFVDIM
ncbi:segment polarity protein dishevelled homolog DVL-3a [Ictalurus punctatus]|uniref:Segment polarity protein dishevelled homolog DVL-3a n=1 Tax=Ictalurus punctatus TaxID=7998 RepID=A0A2D0RDC0_ICTPU|nr:segment polarity protein dishevelled homolog DVL-3a [Ictalurus punctatus]